MTQLRSLLLLLVPLLLASCAGNRGGRESPPESVTVVVRNDLRPATSVTVRLVAEGGGRHLLGSIPPQANRSLAAELGVVSGTYHLEAQGTDGREVRSRSFSLFPYSRVDWNLFSNLVTIDAP